MTDTGVRAVAAVARLRRALERTADALVRPQLDSLLHGESETELALAELPAMDDLPADERRAVGVEIDGARRALLRCRRLGAALDDFVRVSLETQGGSIDYGLRRVPPHRYSRPAVDARV